MNKTKIDRSEVGFAAMNTQSTELAMYQFRDTNSYHRTFSLLFQYDPVEVLNSKEKILVPDLAQNTVLKHKISKNFNFSQVKAIQRKYFGEDAGIRLLKSVCTLQSISRTSLDSSMFTKT
ncbi:MutS protein msh4 [Bonamia ostreae]|uniref:MutS protein msh4 n=1 Tax=Bonamia ostreae TaxID=126728 RepID=A0ABV2ATC4_9EUKA